MYTYNTQQPKVLLKEYGRNIQKIVDYIVKIEEKEERTRYAHTLINLMRQINPYTRDSQEYQNKLWDDLYIMSKFSLDVDSPSPMPEKSILGRKPKRLDYNSNELKYRHYGKNIELLIEKAVKLDDPEDKYAAIAHVGRLMKAFYISWNKDNIQYDTIIEHIEKISRKKLTQDIKERAEAEKAFESMVKERKNNSSSSKYNNNSGKKPKKKKK